VYLLRFTEINMPKIFISYKHEAAPDERLVEYLGEHLRQSGHDVFTDKQILVGDEWPKKIKQEIETSEFFLVLLSSHSIQSEMVIEEVRIAYKRRKQHTIPMILPIRVAYYVDLPYDLGSYLNRINYVLWNLDADEKHIVEVLLAAINQRSELGESSPLPQSLKQIIVADDGNIVQSNEEVAPPRPEVDPHMLAELHELGGAVKLRSKLYVERHADRIIRSAILDWGTTTCIKGARQIGKSSLLVRAYRHACEHKFTAVYVTFQEVDKDQFNDLDTLLRYLAEKISRELKTTESPQYFWNSRLGSKDKISDFIDQAILRVNDAPVVLIMDEVDRLLHVPYRDDFFSLIRSWHERRAREETFDKLNLVLAYSTEPFLFIQDASSPFNVGLRIELTDFNRDQVEDLNRRHEQLARNDNEIDTLMQLVGGHPYLVRRAFYDLVIRGWTMQQLINEALADDGPFGEHLHRYLLHLHHQPELRAAMKEILRGDTCSDDLLFYRLRSAGLVQGHSRHSAVLRCGLYAQYFGKHL
jgi:hypothetical protein